MTINQSFTRIDTLRIKESILKSVGGTRYETYSTLLRRFFSGSLSAVEFQRLCIQTIGSENLHLHNDLIKGILQNVYSAGAGVASSKNNPSSSDKVGGKRGCKPKAMPLNENSLIGSSDDVKPKRGRKRKDPPSDDLSLTNAKTSAGRKLRDRPLNDSSLTSPKIPAGRKRKDPPPNDVSLTRAKTPTGFKWKDQPPVDSSFASAETPAGHKRKDPPLNDSSLASTKTPGRLKQNDQLSNDASLTSTKTPAGRKRRDPPSYGMSLTSSSDLKTPDGCQGNIPTAKVCFPSSTRRARTIINRPCRFKKCASPVVPVIEPVSVSPAKVPITPEHPCIGSSRPAVESSEDTEQIAVTPGVLSVSPPITAPFGISNNLFGPSKAKALCVAFVLDCENETCLVKRELPNSFSLMNRLDRMLRMEGMNASVDSANLLNKALDLYLKRLIKPITDLSGTRSPASLLDFKTAMALEPQVLGEHWPSQLERISHRFSDKELAHNL